jgi:Ca-activated chloride channel family protein
MKLLARLAHIAASLLLVALAACEPSGPEFTILSGSENEVLAPLMQEFCNTRHAKCTMTYLGSLDIALTLKPGSTPEADAVWPASSTGYAGF